MSFRHIPLGSESASSPPPNRRATVRYHCPPATLGRYQLPPKQEQQPVWILDVSLNGIGLLVSRALEPGLSVVIRMSDTAGAKVYDLSAHVVHATKEPGGDWIVGCRLDKTLSQHDLDALL